MTKHTEPSGFCIRQDYFCFIIPLLVLAFSLPPVMAKPTIFVLLLALIARFHRQLFVMKWASIKPCLLLFMLPGFFLSVMHASESIIRFAPLFLIIIFFPYSKISMNTRTVYSVVSLVLIYLVLGQLMIALGIGWAVDFRELFYPYHGVENPFLEPPADSILFLYGEFRAGGVFHNPNDFSSVILLFFLMLQILKRSPDLFANVHKVSYGLILGFTATGLYFSGSRTYAVPFIFAILAEHIMPFVVRIVKSGKLSLPKMSASFVIFLFAAVFFVVIRERLMQGFSEIGSLGIKLKIVSGYLSSVIENQDLVRLFFGGTHIVMFDADWGYWFGATGLVGLVGILIIYLLIFRFLPEARTALICFILVGFGNSLLYGLLSSIQVFLLLIIAAHVASQKNSVS